MISNESLYYVLGLIASDGYVYKNKNLISIGQSHDYGLKLLKEVGVLINPICNKISFYHNNKTDSHTLYINSPFLYNFCIENGIVNKKSLILKWPDIPKVFEFDFLRGYVDGDGCIGIYKNKRGNPIRLLSFVGTEDFITKAHSVLGLETKILKLKAKNCFEARVTGSVAAVLLKNIYKPNLELPESFKFYKAKKIINLNEGLSAKEFKAKNNRKQIQKMLDCGLSPVYVGSVVNIPFQTIYRWIKDGKLTTKST